MRRKRLMRQKKFCDPVTQPLVVRVKVDDEALSFFGGQTGAYALVLQTAIEHPGGKTLVLRPPGYLAGLATGAEPLSGHAADWGPRRCARPAPSLHGGGQVGRRKRSFTRQSYIMDHRALLLRLKELGPIRARVGVSRDALEPRRHRTGLGRQKCRASLPARRGVHVS